VVAIWVEGHTRRPANSICRAARIGGKQNKGGGSVGPLEYDERARMRRLIAANEQEGGDGNCLVCAWSSKEPQVWLKVTVGMRSAKRGT